MSRLTLLPGEADPNTNVAAPPASGPFDDHQAAAEAALREARDRATVPVAQPETEDPRIPVVVMLKPFHHAYLAQRAAMHGEPIARHLETILRQFRAHHDNARPDHQRPAPDVGMPATARRAG